MRGWACANAPSLTLWVARRGGNSLPSPFSCPGLVLLSPSRGGLGGEGRSQVLEALQWHPRWGSGWLASPF